MKCPLCHSFTNFSISINAVVGTANVGVFVELVAPHKHILLLLKYTFQSPVLPKRITKGLLATGCSLALALVCLE